MVRKRPMPKVKKALKQALTKLVEKIADAYNEADAISNDLTEKEESSDLGTDINEVRDGLEDLQNKADAYTGDDSEYVPHD
jgi:uncharacterized coiled-coil DUF342 family protein